MALNELVELDRIAVEAHRIDLGRTALTLLAGLFWLIGFVVGKLVIGVVAAVTYSMAAVKVGWQDAHRQTTRRGVGPA
jgi:hypothetical protein